LVKKGGKIIKKALILDCRKEENVDRIKQILTKTKWLEKFADTPENLTLDVLERLYKKVIKKYPAQIGYIQNAGDNSWAFSLKHTETHEWLYTIYAYTLWEGIAKSLIVLYAVFIKNIPLEERKGE